jgi:hypothetical protein
LKRLLILAAAALLTLPAVTARAAESCGRACLTGLVERYMDALVARTPDQLPWAPIVRYSENAVPMAIGDGTWGTVTARSKTALEAADPKTGEAVWMGEVEEHGQPAFFALRLKAEGGKIAAIEAVIRRSGGPPEYSDPAAWTHEPEFGQASKTPLTRPQLTALVNGYLDQMQGKPTPTRFAPDCGRKVNGVVTTAGKTATGGVEGCQAQIKAGVFKPVERVRARRIAVVDEARGVVVVEGFQDFPEREDVYAGHPAPAKYPYSLGFISAFKIKDGGIWCIEEVSTALPYLMPAP